ncbi:MAG: glycerate kinase [Deltaproteobacteria bacterium]|nr:glycerate kinase [Deltaproteobacteria bacterium]
MKILISPDSFKSVCSSIEAAEIISDELSRLLPESKIISIPVGDGGEGTSNVLTKNINRIRHTVTTVDPLGRPIEAEFFEAVDSGSIYMDTAQSIGYELLSNNERKPIITSSYGLGRALDFIFEKFPGQNIFLSVGGTSTIDGGKDAATAMGFSFMDIEGKMLSRGGGSLPQLSTIQLPENFSFLTRQKLTMIVDVKNFLTGKSGAAKIFGPQKGAKTRELEFFSIGLANLSRVISIIKRENFVDQEGYGAAGGIVALFNSLLGWDFVSGSSFVLEYLEFDKYLQWADLVITGEGCFDSQSINGKVTGEIISRAISTGKRGAVISGKESNERFAFGDFPIYNIDSSLTPPPDNIDVFSKNLRDVCKKIVTNIL